MEVTKRERKENKGKGNKDDGKNSNASLEQSESISMFVLLSCGSLSSLARGMGPSFAFEKSTRMRACTKGDAGLCTHILPSRCCLTKASLLKGSLVVKRFI